MSVNIVNPNTISDEVVQRAAKLIIDLSLNTQTQYANAIQQILQSQTDAEATSINFRSPKEQDILRARVKKAVEALTN